MTVSVQMHLSIHAVAILKREAERRNADPEWTKDCGRWTWQDVLEVDAAKGVDAEIGKYRDKLAVYEALNASASS